MNVDNSNQEPLLGFLSLYETTSHDGYIGSLLITDPHGIPQEFRCTHPIKPTAIQKDIIRREFRNLCWCQFMRIFFAQISSNCSINFNCWQELPT